MSHRNSLVLSVRWFAAMALSVFALAACGDGDSSKGRPTSCSPKVCGIGGSCVEHEGFAYCSCAKGWTGDYCSQCATGYVEYPSGSGECRSVCTEGMQDNDGDGVCAPDCEHAGVKCEGGYCDDASGTAVCICQTGWQDKDGDGVCSPDCEHAGLDCGPHSACADGDGTAACLCDDGWQDNDGDGVCAESCEAVGATLCPGDHELCADEDGTALCLCETGFARDDEGTCVDEASLVAWTLMVYLDGDNSLGDSGSSWWGSGSDYAADDLKEMLSLSEANRVNLIVLYDNTSRGDTKVYRIAAGAKETLSTGSEIFSGSEADMSDWKTMKNFGVWAVKNYPAARYGLVFWNHGGGWKDGNGGASSWREFASDDSSGGGGIMLSNGDYGKALEAIATQAGRKLDMVGFDACLMGMYEVAAATQPYAGYLVGSEASEPASGWDWSAVTSALSETPAMDAETLGRTIVKSYYKQGSDTLSLVDLSRMDPVHAALTAFSDQLVLAIADSSHKSAIKSIRSSIQEFDYEEHVDLMDFAQDVAKSSSLPEGLKASASELVAALKGAIVVNMAQRPGHGSSGGYSGANGMAIFFPESLGGSSWYSSSVYDEDDLATYLQTPWAPLSTWDEFLDAYL